MEIGARLLAAIAGGVLIPGGCATTGHGRNGTAPPDPPALAGTLWLAEDIGGRGVIDMLQSTLEFDAEDATRVAGNAGCNRYSGTAGLDGWKIAFGAMTATRRACPPAVMDQEIRFLAALGEAHRYELDSATGLLTIYDTGDDAVLRFSRLDE